jgi:hypothetical protein
MGTIIQDDKGNTSSFRAMLLLFALLWFFLIMLWGYSFWLEMNREQPNYNGLAVLFGALVVQILGMIAGHVIRKRYENEAVVYDEDIDDEVAEQIVEAYKQHKTKDKPNEIQGFKK